MIGEVVYMHVDPACMTDGYIDMRKLDPIGRLNGFFYATIGEILERKFDDGSRASFAADGAVRSSSQWPACVRAASVHAIRFKLGRRWIASLVSAIDANYNGRPDAFPDFVFPDAAAAPSALCFGDEPTPRRRRSCPARRECRPGGGRSDP